MDFLDSNMPVQIRAYLFAVAPLISSLIVICYTIPVFTIALIPVSILYYFSQVYRFFPFRLLPFLIIHNKAMISIENGNTKYKEHYLALLIKPLTYRCHLMLVFSFPLVLSKVQLVRQ